MKKIILSLIMIWIILGVVSAEVNPITPSTNDINRDNGWAHVDEIEMGVGETTLEFIQPRNFYSCFEYRTDGDTSQATGEPNYNPDITDGLYPYYCQNGDSRISTIEADEYLEVRMVFGAETDERFDWTLFEVIPKQTDWSIPEGTNEIDALAEVDTEMTIETTGDIEVTIVEETDPEAFPDGLKSAGKVINVDVSDENAIEWPIYIRIYYTQEDLDNAGLTEDKLVGIFFWDEEGNEWVLYDDTGVKTDYSDGDYIGYFWVYADHLTVIGGGGDLLEPVIDEESIIVNPEHPQTEDEVSICVDVTDENGIASVKLSCTASNGAGIINQPMTNTIEDTYCGTANDMNPNDGITVDCTIDAEDLGQNTDSADVEQFVFDGEAPVSEFTCDPLEIDEGMQIVCTSTSTDSVSAHGDLEHYWTFDEGDFNHYVGSDGIAIDYFADGEYTIELTVVDEAGFENTLTKTDYIIVNDLEPEASFTSDSPKNEGELISFTDDSESYDNIVSWSWDFGDDEGTSDLQNPTYTYMNDGEYDVSLTVVDSDGSEDTYTESVTVNDLSLTASFTSDSPRNEGELISFTDDSESYDNIVSWSWDFGDDEGTSDLQNPTYTYMNDGEYDVSLTVVDSDGSEDTYTESVTVNDNDPDVALTGDTVFDEGEEGSYDASESSSSPNEITLYEWDWNYNGENFNPSGDEGAMQTHTYNDNGEYTVAVKVSDDDSSDIATIDVTVNNVAPTFDNLPASETAFVNEIFTFDVDATDVGVEDVLTYDLVSYPTGMEINSGTGEITWTPSEEQYGDYEVIISIIDDGINPVEGTLNMRVNSFGIELSTGWNLFSIPLVPVDTDTNAVLPSEISSNAVKLWAYKEGDWDYTEPNQDGETWDHSSGRLKNIVPGYGYYIKMNEGAIIYHDGEKYYGTSDNGALPMPPQVVLTTGWNLIGHYGMNEIEKSRETFDLSGGILTDLANVNLLNQQGLPVSMLVPGEGYWAFITGQDNLLYAPSEADYSELEE